jgi:AcrR family transcriptional regulator
MGSTYLIVKRDNHMKPATKREQVVAAARKLFLDAGYGATSMDAIAAEACVSKRTVYSHFQNKENLFAAIMGDMCNILSDSNPNEPSSSDNPEKVLKQVGLYIMQSVFKPEALDVFRVVLAESSAFPELGKAFWKAGPNVMKNYLAEYLRELDHQGVLKVKNPDLSAFQFMGMVKWPYHMRLLFGAGNSPTEGDIEESLDLAVLTFVNGLKPVQ